MYTIYTHVFVSLGGKRRDKEGYIKKEFYYVVRTLLPYVFLIEFLVYKLIYLCCQTE